MTLKHNIISYAEKLGFDGVGFTSAEPFLKEKEILIKRMKENLISPFEERDLDLRCDPQRILPGAKTIICFAMGYLIHPHNFAEPENDEIRLTREENNPKGRFSRYALVKDYHLVLGKKLKDVVDFISNKQEGQFKILVDTGGLVERAAAQRAGLGWIGENTCFFTPKLGSWVFLGEIITDIEIQPDAPMENKCKSCGRCVRACPTDALMGPFQINPYKCLSYITQMRGVIPEKYIKPLKDRIFGCDTCQEVCPNNQQVKIPSHKEFIPEFPIEKDSKKLAKLSKADFDKIFKDTASGWRGRNVIRRNAVFLPWVILKIWI